MLPLRGFVLHEIIPSSNKKRNLRNGDETANQCTVDSSRFNRSLQRHACFLIWWYSCQWHIQRLPDAGIPVWKAKLCAQIKEKLMQNNINYLIRSSTQERLHLLRLLIYATHLKLFNERPYVCLCLLSSLFKCITKYRLYKQIKPLHSTGVPKCNPGYGTACLQNSHSTP